KIDLGQEVCVQYQTVAGVRYRRRKKCPRHQCAEIEDRIGGPIVRQIREMSKDDRENYHGKEWLKNSPCDSEQCLFVPYLQVAEHEEVEQLSEDPEFAHRSHREIV